MVLVTGGAKGIGRMISEAFITNGATVYISSRDTKACAKAVEELNSLQKGTAHYITADFSHEEDCKRLAEELSTREKRMFPLLFGLSFLGGFLFRSTVLSRDTILKALFQTSISSSIILGRHGVHHTTNTHPLHGRKSSP